MPSTIGGNHNSDVQLLASKIKEWELMFGLEWNGKFKNYGQKSGFVSKQSGNIHFSRMPQQVRDFFFSASNHRPDKASDARPLDTKVKHEAFLKGGPRGLELGKDK